MQRVRVDGKIRGAIEFIMAHQVPMGADAYFKPRGDSPEAIRNANYANELFGLGGGEAKKAGLESFEGRGKMCDASFAARFRTISNWQLDGFTLHEEIYYTAKGADGVERVWLRDLRPRWGGHVEGWHADDYGNICAATLRRPGITGAQTYRLPIANDPEHKGGIKGALHIALDIDGADDPEGRMGALLRACSGPQRLKEHLYNQLGIGAVRWAMPIPKVRVLTQIAEQAGVHIDTLVQAKALAAEAAAGFSSDDGSYLADSDLVEIGEFGGSFDPSGIVEVINLLNHEMLTALFMHWLAMGVAQSHGSGSAAITHGNAVLQVSRELAARTCREIERQTVRRMLEMNFAEVGPVPELVLPGIDPNPLSSVDIVGAVNIGALTPTDDLEAVIRRQIPGVSLDFPSRHWADRLDRASATPSGGAGGRPEGSVKPIPTEVRSALDAALDSVIGREAAA